MVDRAPAGTTGAAVRLRAIAEADLAVVARLNDAEVPRVGHLGDPGLAALLPRCEVAVAATDDADRIAGFLLALGPGSDYASLNYGWFEARGTDHLYVDRVVVAPHARRCGVAGLLYDEVEARASAHGRDEVTCEVNLVPRNDASSAFHAARGYLEVGQQETGGKRVAMLARPLAPAVGTSPG